jgi:YgiT-type zinc finger domain-containing protein
MKRQNKTSVRGPRAKPHGELCPMCGKGTTHIVKLDYKLKDENGKEFVVPDLEVEICDFCGEKIFNMAAVRKAERIQGRVGKILIRLKPALQSALSARAQKNKRSLTQEAQHLIETSLAAN